MIAGMRLPDHAPERERRMTVVLPVESVAALDELARHHRRDRRAEAVRLLVAAIDRDLALLRVATEPPRAGVPRSVQARRRAAAGAALGDRKR